MRLAFMATASVVFLAVTTDVAFSDSKLWVHGPEQAASLNNALRNDPSLADPSSAIIPVEGVMDWARQGAGGILLGVTADEMQLIGKLGAAGASEKLQATPLGALFGTGGNDVLIFAPDNVRVILPLVYALHKLPEHVQIDSKGLAARLQQGNPPANLAKALAALPAQGQESWPMKSMVIRYPAQDDDDGDDDSCGCDDGDQRIMSCDPDGYADQFFGRSPADSYDGPALRLSDDTANPQFALIEGDDDCPVCESPQWRRIPQRRDPQEFLSKWLPHHGGTDSQREIDTIISEAAQLPSEKLSIYVMSCDPD